MQGRGRELHARFFLTCAEFSRPVKASVPFQRRKWKMGHRNEATVCKICDTWKKKNNLANKQMPLKLARVWDAWVAQ